MFGRIRLGAHRPHFLLAHRGVRSFSATKVGDRRSLGCTAVYPLHPSRNVAPTPGVVGEAEAEAPHSEAAAAAVVLAPVEAVFCGQFAEKLPSSGRLRINRILPPGNLASVYRAP